MKIINETHWRTDQLRAIIARTATDELDSSDRRRLLVTVAYGAKSSGVSGRAACGGPWVKLFVSRVEIDRVSLAHTTRHELAHFRGLRHPAMRGSRRYSYVEGWRALDAWADEMPLEVKPAAPRPTADERRALKLTRAKDSLARWERRLKVAHGRVRRWRGRVRDYERYTAIAAQAAGKEN